MSGESTKLLPSFKELLTSIPSEAYTFKKSSSGASSSPRVKSPQYPNASFNLCQSRSSHTTMLGYNQDLSIITSPVDSVVGLPSPPSSVDLCYNYTNPSPIIMLKTHYQEPSHYHSYIPTIHRQVLKSEPSELTRMSKTHNLSHGTSYSAVVLQNSVPYHNKLSTMSTHDRIKPYLVSKPKVKQTNSFSEGPSKKRHVCKICSRVFTTSGHLARHNRIHTGERKHECPWPSCNAKFSRQDNCMQHYGTHIKAKKRKSA